jgi:uncharacterized protein YggU (UPF0235/DUF167 family)
LSVRLSIAVKPGSKRPGLEETASGFVLRVRERAVEGAANDACIRAIAAALDVAPSQVELLRGARSRQKLFSIDGGLTEDELVLRLRAYCS